MKPQHGAYIICAIFAALFTLLVLFLPITVNLLVAYCFSMLSIAITACAIVDFNKKDIPISITLLKKSASYAPWTLLVSATVLALQWFGVYTLSLVGHLAIQVAVLLLFGIRYYKIFTAKAYVENIDKEVIDKKANISEWTAKVEAVTLRDGLSEEAKQALKKVREALRYSDPMSNDSVLTHNYHINELLVKLSITPEDNIPVVCHQIIAQVNTRNSVLKRNK